MPTRRYYKRRRTQASQIAKTILRPKENAGARIGGWSDMPTGTLMLHTSVDATCDADGNFAMVVYNNEFASHIIASAIDPVTQIATWPAAILEGTNLALLQSRFLFGRHLGCEVRLTYLGPEDERQGEIQYAVTTPRDTVVEAGTTDLKLMETGMSYFNQQKVPDYEVSGISPLMDKKFCRMVSTDETKTYPESNYQMTRDSYGAQVWYIHMGGNGGKYTFDIWRAFEGIADLDQLINTDVKEGTFGVASERAMGILDDAMPDAAYTPVDSIGRRSKLSS